MGWPYRTQTLGAPTTKKKTTDALVRLYQWIDGPEKMAQTKGGLNLKETAKEEQDTYHCSYCLPEHSLLRERPYFSTVNHSERPQGLICIVGAGRERSVFDSQWYLFCKMNFSKLVLVRPF